MKSENFVGADYVVFPFYTLPYLSYVQVCVHLAERGGGMDS